MKAIKKIFLLFATFLMISNTAQAQCNASNSPTFQLTTSQATLATNGVCGMQINIMNAVTNPTPGGALSFCIMAPGQSTCIAQYSITATFPGIWTVAVKDLNNSCVTSKTVQVNSLPAPIVSVVASNTLVCSGDMATLTASGANSYIWNTSATTASISVAPTTSSIYRVKGTGINGCMDTAFVAVTVSPLPNLTAAANQNSVCVNQIIQLTAQGANTYTWNNSATGSQYTPPAFTIPGTYHYTVQLQGTSNAGCMSTNVVSVTFLVQACDVGLTEYSNSNQTKIYPNPVKEILNVESENINAEIKIVDSLGKEILSVKNANQINVSELPKGVYFIKIGKEVGKFLKE